jgi:predicted TIM-barrel fold metal-dependent hydrolase
MIIDVHAHYYPARYTALLAGANAKSRAGARLRPDSDKQQDIDARLNMMDAAGVQMQVLSPASSAPYLADEQQAVEAARLANGLYADLVAHYPNRFSAFVSLPLPHIDASLRELARGLDDLAMVGVAMNCSIHNRSAAELEFEPIYDELNRRGAAVFYHPCQNGVCSPMVHDYGFTTSAGASMEDTVLVLHLIARQIPVRYPKIKYIVPHFGGMIPTLLNRLDNQVPANHPELREQPSVTAKRLYYDTVGHGSLPALHSAHQAFGARQLLPGSDYPVLLDFESYTETFDYIRRSGLSEADIQCILHNNAPRVLGIQCGSQDCVHAAR